MKKILLIFPVVFIFSSFLFSFDYRGAITVDGLKRDYKVHVPDIYNPAKAVPLIVALHGGGGRIESMEWLTNFNKLSETEGVIVVYPAGFLKQWNDGRAVEKIEAQKRELDDVGFILMVIDEVSVKYSIDKKRIYATGISNGGFMCQRLACDAPERFAAIAPVSASIPEKLSGKAGEKGKIPVMLIHGTGDPLVPYSGGAVKIGRQERGFVLSAPDTAKLWAKMDGCIRTKSETITGDMNTVCDYYEGRDGMEVVFCTVMGGGHSWPGGPQYLPDWIVGKSCRDFKATQFIWDFFKRHSR
ncbi:MAG: PHB depolymerase family esterase [Candidatus Goldiibacteriota bacterium]|jgi:polyhydroxybutyrate depolymerase